MTGLRILYFHLVTDSPKTYFPGSTTLNSDLFERQMKYLSRRYGFIGLDEVQNRMRQGKKFKNEILLTTDDGFKENHSVLMPILDLYKAPALLFLTTKCLNNQHMMWRHLIFHLESIVRAETKFRIMNEVAGDNCIDPPRKEEGMVNWSFRTFPMGQKDELSLQLWERSNLQPIEKFLREEHLYLNDLEVEELLAAGHQLGSHTVTHPDCARLSIEELKEEVTRSVAFIEGRYQTKVTSFSFPFGRPADERISRKIASFGDIQMIFGVREGKKGSNHPNRLERTSIEMGFNRFLFNFHLNPMREKYLRL